MPRVAINTARDIAPNRIRRNAPRGRAVGGKHATAVADDASLHFVDRLQLFLARHNFLGLPTRPNHGETPLGGHRLA